MSHRWGFMYYCERCGCSMADAVNKLLPCTGTPNVRSLQNELMWKACPLRPAVDEIVAKWFP